MVWIVIQMNRLARARDDDVGTLVGDQILPFFAFGVILGDPRPDNIFDAVVF